MSSVEERVDVPDSVQGALARSVGVLLRLQVSLEDRLQDQHGSHLHHTILDRRDGQSELHFSTARPWARRQ